MPGWLRVRGCSRMHDDSTLSHLQPRAASIAGRCRTPEGPRPSPQTPPQRPWCPPVRTLQQHTAGVRCAQPGARSGCLQQQRTQPQRASKGGELHLPQVQPKRDACTALCSRRKGSACKRPRWARVPQGCPAGTSSPHSRSDASERARESVCVQALCVSAYTPRSSSHTSSRTPSSPRPP